MEFWNDKARSWYVKHTKIEHEFFTNIKFNFGKLNDQYFLQMLSFTCQTYSPPGYMGGSMLHQTPISLWVVTEWSLLFNVINDHSFLHIHAVSLQLKG